MHEVLFYLKADPSKKWKQGVTYCKLSQQSFQGAQAKFRSMRKRRAYHLPMFIQLLD